MFKNKTFQVKMVKDTPTGDTQNAPTYLMDLSNIRKEHIKYVAVATVGVIAGRKILNTACEVIVIAATSKFN